VAVLPVLAAILIFPQYPIIPLITGILLLVLLLSFSPGEPQEWLSASWDFAKQILPLLLLGVLVSGSYWEHLLAAGELFLTLGLRFSWRNSIC